jgi:hypothetical protein
LPSAAAAMPRTPRISCSWPGRSTARSSRPSPPRRRHRRRRLGARLILAQSIASRRRGLGPRLAFTTRSAGPGTRAWSRPTSSGARPRDLLDRRLHAARSGKCDAYESYVEDCGEAAGCAAVPSSACGMRASRWSAARRRSRRRGRPRPDAVIEAASQATVGTRH